MVTSLGTTALAAHAIALRVESLSFNPGWGFSVAAAALVGQSLGASKPREAVRIAAHACFLGMAFMGSLGIFFLIAGPWVVTLFGATPEVVDQAGSLIRIAAASQIFMAAFFVLGGVLRGAGDTRSPLIVTLIGTLPMRLGLVWLFGFHFGWGIEGVWWACVIDWSVRALLMWLFFRRGKWRDTVV
ncbi:MAG: polysaccharide biosynthesis C-terminal domain-containing protein [Verrucomicrobia bacterium]|nr:polysaccharide biosynthesis C-terminal domain-containing protein [Verrucomicrobiota bacterium]